MDQDDGTDIDRERVREETDNAVRDGEVRSAVVKFTTNLVGASLLAKRA